MGRRWPGEELAPDSGTKGESAEQHQYRSNTPDHPVRDYSRQELLGPDPAGECGQTGADPGRIGALGGKNCPIGGQLGPAIGAVLLWLWCVTRHGAAFRGIL